MSTNGPGSAPDEQRRYLVQCDGCSFEQPAERRDDATAIGTAHHDETRHRIVVVEVPPSMHSE